MSPLPPDEHRTVQLFGLPVAAMTLPQVQNYLLHRANRNADGTLVVFTPNVDHVVRVSRDAELRDMYLSADLLLADGAPVVWASRLLGDTLPGRVTGADLMPALLEQAKSGTRVAIVGSAPEQSDSDTVWLSRHFPNINLRIFAPPADLDVSSEASIAISEDVAEFAPQLVFICLGFPKQERWARLHRDRMTGAVVICCGAALDFMVGRVRRAPTLVRRAGFEWLWRLTLEPRRLWRRYLRDDAVFAWIVFREWRARRR